MRLLQQNSNGDIHLTKHFFDDIPPYAILSHTWGDDEVTYEDLMEGKGEGKIGYQKIQFCGIQASKDGLRYFWIDTCCIDKSSSTELQEAINSMFKWYKSAVKCYVYLSDVPNTDAITASVFEREQWIPAFRNSRWFTRGWTLQELLAPASVEFFSKEGIKLGNKKSLEQVIRKVTRLPSDALRGSLLANFSVQQRLSWTEQRNTTRPEDKAYSLLGIFDVHMPMIYGEGTEKAFRRLREEIAKDAQGELSAPPTRQVQCYKCGEYGHYASDVHCYTCGEYGHYANEHCRECGELGHDVSDVHCYTCGEYGHYSPDCPRK